MSAADYRCAMMDCDRPATSVYTRKVGASGLGFYGTCDEHRHELDPDETWLHAPADAERGDTP